MTGRHREGLRGLQAKTLVRPLLVVFSPPVLDDHACLGQRPELLPVEALGPEPGMEALDEPPATAGPRTPGIDVERFDSGFFQPLLQLAVDELTRFARPSGCLRQSIFAALRFTSVVTANVLGSSMDADQPLELPTDIAGADPTIHVDEMVLPSELVDDRQHLQPTSPDSAVVNEVPGPHMSSMCRRHEPAT